MEKSKILSFTSVPISLNYQDVKCHKDDHSNKINRLIFMRSSVLIVKEIAHSMNNNNLTEGKEKKTMQFNGMKESLSFRVDRD